MGQYGITGWSSGARVPLTYNLKAGQMRGMGRSYIFPNNTYVNNNFYGSNYDCGCNCNSNSTPGWMNWMMGIGLGSSLLGGILGMFAKKDDSAEGAGGSEKTTETSKETTKELSKQEQARKTLDSIGLTKKEGYEVFADEDGNVIYRYTDPNDPKNTREAKNLAELLNIGKNTTPKTEVKPKNSEKAETSEEELEDGSFTSAIDEKLGTSSQIKGRVSINPDTREVNIEDTTNTYTYAKGSRTIEYKGKQYTVYSLTGATNNKTGKAVSTTEQEYILINGQLVQPKDCKGLKGLGTGSTPPPTNVL